MKMKIAITVDDELLVRLDAFAKRRGFNRSQLMERFCWLELLRCERREAGLEQDQLHQRLRRSDLTESEAAQQTWDSAARKRYVALDDEFMRRFPDEWKREQGVGD